MKRCLTCISALVLSVGLVSAPVSARDGVYAKGDMMIGAGIGIVPFIPGAHFDIAVHDMVSVGAAMGVHIPWIDIPLIGRGAFHPFYLPPLRDKIDVKRILDPYVGVIAGISIDPGDDTPVLPSFGEFIGCRFFISESFGFYAEESATWPGEDLGFLSGGVVFKF
ncbi:MAG: hypothetical protein GF418_09360 [Chitinivibrionales bacterium]|nr:hypothetical protein [Chitinivibrionales bacterium]MBD3395816.1 hypothetical protein [Chitinivibrionales bacterium]